MVIKEITTPWFEEILNLERALFKREAFNRISLFQYLRIFSDTCLMAISNQQVIGYTLGMVKSSGEGWVLALGVKPISLQKQRTAIILARELQTRMLALNMKVGYATTRRRRIIELAKMFSGRVIREEKDYYLNGNNRYVLEFSV